MSMNGLDLVLIAPDGSEQEVIASLRWPTELDAEARVFVRDNLIAERVGDSRKAALLLAKGVVSADERQRFLADKVFVPPDISERLASAIDLEDLVAEFSVGLQKLRRAKAEHSLRLTWV